MAFRILALSLAALLSATPAAAGEPVSCEGLTNAYGRILDAHSTRDSEANTALLERVLGGCKADDRIARFGETATCFVNVSNERDWQSCRKLPQSEAFEQWFYTTLRFRPQAD
jgi:hypothetical protein